MAHDLDATLARLERLAHLHETGVLTADEFAAEKARLLGGTDAPSRDARRRWWAGSIAAVALAAVGTGALVGRGVATPEPGASPTPRGAIRREAAASPVPGPVPSAAPTATHHDLSDALAFSDIGNCVLSPAAQRAVDALQSADRESGETRQADRLTLGGLTLPATPRVRDASAVVDGGRVFTNEVRFPAESSWQGLRLGRLAIEYGDYPEIDKSLARGITFRESLARVRATLARLGASIPANGDVVLEDGGCGGSMALSEVAGGIEWSCSWGC